MPSDAGSVGSHALSFILSHWCQQWIVVALRSHHRGLGKDVTRLRTPEEPLLCKQRTRVISAKSPIMVLIIMSVQKKCEVLHNLFLNETFLEEDILLYCRFTGFRFPGFL